MRALVLCPYLPDAPDRGGKIRTRVLLGALRRLGTVTVAVPVDAGDAGARRLLQAELDVEVAAIPAAPDPRPSPRRKLGCWLRGASEVLDRRWKPSSRRAVAELARAAAPDAIVLDSSFVLPLQPGGDVPSVLHLHNVESALLGRRDAVRRGTGERLARAVEARLMARAEAAAARRARLVLTVSELDAERVRRLDPAATVAVVGNSVDLERLPLLPAPPAAPPTVLFVGTFDYPPNVAAARELVEEHLPRLREVAADLRVRLVGHDPEGAVAGLARHGGVEIAGRVADVVPHYRDAVAVYLPIREGGGTRIKVLEACALGRPVLATAVAAEGLSLQPDVHFLCVETPAAGAAALSRVLRGETAAMVAAARRRVEERHGHEAATARMAELLDRCLS